jgi:hypothetical protein
MAPMDAWSSPKNGRREIRNECWVLNNWNALNDCNDLNDSN